MGDLFWIIGLVTLSFCSGPFSHICEGFPLKKKSAAFPKVPPAKALDFMKKFGYLESNDDDSSGAIYSEVHLQDAIRNIQRFGAVPETGVLDNATLELMSSPRCGVPDILKNKRSKRYTLGSQGWNKRKITYFIANWSPSLDENTVVKNIQMALDIWGKYGRLTFERTASPDADIVVAFGRGYHGDSFPFDGPGTILAHAFFPYEYSHLGGDIHFDDDEPWTDRGAGGPEDGMDFFTVALHELGHSLGLAHSAVANSVMFPYYRGYEPATQFQLAYDDILGMYELYIRRNIDDNSVDSTYNEESPSSTTPYYNTPYYTSSSTESYTSARYSTTLSPSDNTTYTYEGDHETVDDHKKHDDKHRIPSTNSPSFPDICNGHFDAVAELRNELFIFKDQYIWRLRDLGLLVSGYPVPIYQMFPELPKSVKKIDAVYERPDGMIILFVGRYFWVYDGKSFVENSPRPLTDYGLPKWLDSIDAVQIWGRNKKTYLYKADRFWRYNEATKQMDPNYPRHMEKWRKVPEYLDAATTWKGVTYFFKAYWYWKFDNNWVMATDESPQPTPQIWMKCPEDENKMILPSTAHS